MPIRFARALTGHQRSAAANRQLGIALCFVAGAINAGGFVAVQQYTSHVTGIVSSMAEHLVQAQYHLLWVGGAAVLAFVLGAACSSMIISYGHRRGLHSEFAWPLLLEALLLLCFGLLGGSLAQITGLLVPLTVLWLCFLMGLQNALITKVSRAEIRTTHITGIVTDFGIELGRMLYWNRYRNDDVPRVTADRDKLWLMLWLALAFFCGGVAGAFGFTHLGYIATVPLAIVLVLLSSVPVIDEALALLRRLLNKSD
ncbi:YoaK family protein [Pseudomonas sp. 5P_3.1_Bac2]|uniref:YoaK family protein n=1 Tax=Pseudomonas sp. 5P_3.1_Bac2 TaxID=2971617 RepID=UPI0021CAB1F6|nr:YoaK family protein [Pseudomonas sp. 5P_3.1_Bac2]MCU1719157.1 DUF1275 domain-containing protein [Pseudomonas sp. 5P_3.1_Bac2]